MRLWVWRPLEGWRRFLDEIVIVVLGVLLALGAGQIVESIRWARDTASTREALNNELAVAGSYALDCVAIEPCLRQRLQHLAGKLQTPGPWRADAPQVALRTTTALPRVYAVPYRYWPTAAWQAALASNGLAHMRKDEAQLYAVLYRNVEMMRDIQEHENASAPQLVPLAFDRQLDNDRREQLLAMLGDLDQRNSLITTVARGMIARLRAAGVLRAPGAVQTVNHWVPIQRKLRGACVRPIQVLPPA